MTNTTEDEIKALQIKVGNLRPLSKLLGGLCVLGTGNF